MRTCPLLCLIALSWWCRKWRAVSHPLNANPFPGSLLNYKARLRLHEVTVDNKSFLQLECSFETEHEVRTQLAFQILFLCSMT